MTRNLPLFLDHIGMFRHFRNSLLGFALLLTACDRPPDGPAAASATPVAAADSAAAAAAPASAGSRYDFTQPSARFELADDLEEISGIALIDATTLAAVQDEKANLYLIDPADGSIRRTVDFGKKGDYEDVALAAGALFVLESNGTLHRLDDWNGEKAKATEIELDLPKKCDAEGLAYDGAGLVVVCKEEPGQGLDGRRAAYAFDLDGAPRGSGPAFTLDLDALAQAGGWKAKDFKPAALAIHPHTGRRYVLSSAARALAILSAEGTLEETVALDAERFPQPEGLAFTPEGDLFISSEGAGGPGLLFRFSPQP